MNFLYKESKSEKKKLLGGRGSGGGGEVGGGLEKVIFLLRIQI